MKCTFASTDDKIDRIMAFLRAHGDDLPEEAIQASVGPNVLDNWSTICDDQNNIISGGTYDHNDWFLCTLKNLATDPKHRGKGLGTEITDLVVAKCKDNPDCYVLAADITHNNEASKRTLLRIGFEEKTRFCFGKDREPSDILHYVRFPTKNNGKDC